MVLVINVSEFLQFIGLRLGENHSVFCSHFLGKPHGSSEMKIRILIKKWTRYGFGLGQGRLGMKSGKRSILLKLGK